MSAPFRTLALAFGAALLLALWFVFDTEPPASRAFALSPQQCNTNCQTRQTDCILACDGNIPCERRCTKAGQACVERCRSDAGAGTAANHGGGGRRGR